MTRFEAAYDHFRRTRPGRVITHPATLLLATMMSVLSFVVALYVLFEFSQQNGHTADIAAQKAQAAVEQAESSQRQAAQATHAAVEAARVAFCRIVSINAGNDPPPSTARGFANQEAYRELGKLPLFHCFTE
jgi:hypothetical protein